MKKPAPAPSVEYGDLKFMTDEEIDRMMSPEMRAWTAEFERELGEHLPAPKSKAGKKPPEDKA